VVEEKIRTIMKPLRIVWIVLFLLVGIGVGWAAYVDPRTITLILVLIVIASGFGWIIRSALRLYRKDRKASLQLGRVGIRVVIAALIAGIIGGLRVEGIVSPLVALILQIALLAWVCISSIRIMRSKSLD